MLGVDGDIAQGYNNEPADGIKQIYLTAASFLLHKKLKEFYLL